MTDVDGILFNDTGVGVTTYKSTTLVEKIEVRIFLSPRVLFSAIYPVHCDNEAHTGSYGKALVEIC